MMDLECVAGKESARMPPWWFAKLYQQHNVYDAFRTTGKY